MRHEIAAILLLLPLSGAFAQETIVLSPGHQELLEAPGVVRAAIGNSRVADVKALPESKQVIVMGKAPGSTDLILWFADERKSTYAIQVNQGGRNVGTEVRALLEGMEGIELRNAGGRLIIDGQIFRGEDLDRLRQVLELYPSVVNLTRVNAKALAYIARQVEGALRTAGIDTITVQPAGNTLFLEGDASDKRERERAVRIAQAIFSSITDHLSVGVEVESLILVDLKLMEVRRNAITDVGVKWPSTVDVTGQLALNPAGPAGSMTIGEGSTATLRALIEKGDAKLLANPKLLCRSGTPASFLAGGEFPIRLIGERTASVEFKKYGLTLNVSARSDASRQVAMEVEAIMSDLDLAGAVDGVPGILENQVKTAANLRFGDTVVLAGLMENRQRKNVQKVPFLGHLPILGELFKSRSFQNNESEFLVLLSPIPADVKSPTHQTQIRRMKQKLDRADEDLDFSLLD